MTLHKIFEYIYLFKDVVNVYILKDKKKGLLIDFGSGNVLDHLKEVGIEKVEYIFHTHYHRDQCFGDYEAIERNVKIGVPYKEQRLFKEAEEFWRIISFYDLYYFKPTYFVNPYNITIDLAFKDQEKFEWGPFSIKTVETSGHTKGSISYLVKYNEKILMFTGDLIHSGGKVITYYDLQYIYNDNGDEGINLSLRSFDKVLKEKPQYLLPSHGEIIQDPTKEIKVLTKKFEKAKFVFCTKNSAVDVYEYSPKKLIYGEVLKKGFPHLVRKGTTFFILGNNNNCFMNDYGGPDFFTGFKLKWLDRFLSRRKVHKIDFVIPSHYHDDHTSGLNILKYRYGVKVYALENMVDVLENPSHYRIGCIFHEPIKVDKILKHGDIISWDDYEFEIFHFPGQTEYHMGMFGDIDGKSVFFVGDSFYANTVYDRRNDVNSWNWCQLGKGVGYDKCADILLECEPEYLAINHYGVIKIKKKMLKDFKDYVSEYEPLISDIVAQDNPNFGYDPNWISFKPIRIEIGLGEDFTTNLVVRNYLNKESKLEYHLNLPKGWKSVYHKNYEIKPKTFEKVPIKIIPPKKKESPGRKILTADIVFNGVNLGPFPDLTVDHDYKPPEFWMGWHPEKAVFPDWIEEERIRKHGFFTN